MAGSKKLSKIVRDLHKLHEHIFELFADKRILNVFKSSAD